MKKSLYLLRNMKNPLKYNKKIFYVTIFALHEIHHNNIRFINLIKKKLIENQI